MISHNENRTSEKHSQRNSGGTRTSPTAESLLKSNSIPTFESRTYSTTDQYFYGDVYLNGRKTGGHVLGYRAGVSSLSICATGEPIITAGQMELIERPAPPPPDLDKQKCNNYYKTHNVHVYGDILILDPSKTRNENEIWTIIFDTFQESSSHHFQKTTFHECLTANCPHSDSAWLDGKRLEYMHETFNRYTYGKFHYMANRNKKSNEPHSIIHSVPNSTTANGPARGQDGSTNGAYQSSAALDPEMTRGVTDIYHKTINMYIHGNIYSNEGKGKMRNDLCLRFPPLNIHKVAILNKGCGIYKITSCDNQQDKLKDHNPRFNETGSQLDTKPKKTDGNSDGEIGSDTVPTHMQQNQEANNTKTMQISSDLSLELNLLVVTVNTNGESVIVNINLGKKANNSGT